MTSLLKEIMKGECTVYRWMTSWVRWRAGDPLWIIVLRLKMLELPPCPPNVFSSVINKF